LLYLYVWRRGFLDGREGLLFSLLISAHELHIDAKLYELTVAAERSLGASTLPTGAPQPNSAAPLVGVHGVDR
jgi:hypothetical protein